MRSWMMDKTCQFMPDYKAGRYVRREDTITRQVKCRRAPFLHRNFDGLLTSFGRIPRGLGHEQRAISEGLLFQFNLHLCRKLFGGDVVQTIVKGVTRLRTRESRGKGVLPDLLGHIPIFDDAILADGVVDGQTGPWSHKDIITVDELLLAVGAVFAVVCWNQGFGSIFTSEASASGGVARVEDNGGDFICNASRS
jgi:hypothetical protein